MPHEEYTIRIGRDGIVRIEGENLSAKQIRDIAGYLVETMGPMRIEVESDGGGRVELTLEDLATDKVMDEEQIRDRVRLRESDAPPE